MRTLVVAPAFARDWKALSDDMRRSVRLTVTRLQKNPLDPTLAPKKLVGTRHKLWRVRLGSWRLIFSYTPTTLVLVRLAHRKDVYRDIS